ncbi:hypothetical protein BCR44DRAFT_1453973, partial [Catenaria anguillulae PL171]
MAARPTSWLPCQCIPRRQAIALARSRYYPVTSMLASRIASPPTSSDMSQCITRGSTKPSNPGQWSESRCAFGPFDCRCRFADNDSGGSAEPQTGVVTSLEGL